MTRRILTAEDIEQLEAGCRLVVDDQTTLTGPARDVARRRGIELVEGGGPQSAADAVDAVLEAQGGRSAAGASGGAAAAGPGGILIVTAVGVNRPGVMAELTSAIGQLGGDIQDVSQRITGGYFNAILVVDIARSGQTFTAFRDALKALSEPSDYVVTVIDERVFTAMHRLG